MTCATSCSALPEPAASTWQPSTFSAAATSVCRITGTLRSEYSRGTAAPSTFGQITSNAQLAQTLSTLYGGNINQVDAWVAGLAEDHLAGSSVGPLFQGVIEGQFQRLRDGDRLFYRGAAA